MRMKSVIAALLTALLASSAGAHHSAAVFDGTKMLTLKGVVKEFQWTNPHCWIQLQVEDEKSAEEWGIELYSPGILSRKGWHPTSLRPGDKITVTVHPLRDGSVGGNLVTLLGPNSQRIGQVY